MLGQVLIARKKWNFEVVLGVMHKEEKKQQCKEAAHINVTEAGTRRNGAYRKKHKIETRQERKGTKMIKIYNIFDFVLIWSILASIVCLSMVIVLCSNAHWYSSLCNYV